MSLTGRVLSVQSSVVCGSVGNKSAVFPLQALGWEVDPVHTVQLSNHKGYPTWKGTQFPAEHFDALFQGLDENALLDQETHLLTGYTPDSSSLEIIAKLVHRLRELNPKLIYVLDPVMGDDGRIYVNQNVVPSYKKLVSMADIITPNDFEVKLLSDVEISSIDSLKTSMDKIHSIYGVPNVVVSSTRFEDNPGTLICAGSSTLSGKKFIVSFPRLEQHFEGVGDVFSALVLAHYLPEEDISANIQKDSSSIAGAAGLGRAVYLALLSLRAILLRTEAAALERMGDPHKIQDPTTSNRTETREERTRRLAAVELKLVQSWNEIRVPPPDPKVVFDWL